MQYATLVAGNEWWPAHTHVRNTPPCNMPGCTTTHLQDVDKVPVVLFQQGGHGIGLEAVERLEIVCYVTCPCRSRRSARLSGIRPAIGCRDCCTLHIYVLTVPYVENCHAVVLELRLNTYDLRGNKAILTDRASQWEQGIKHCICCLLYL